MSTPRELLFLKAFTRYSWDDMNVFLQASANFTDEMNIPLISRYSLSPHVACVRRTVIRLGACTRGLEE